MKTLDRVIASLLILGALGHAAGAYTTFHADPMHLLASLNASLFACLLATIDLLRIARPTDRPLALICLGATLCWLPFILAFGHIVHNFLDPRVDFQLLLALALLALSLRTLKSSPATATT